MRIQLSNVLCATDLSDASNHALPYALALARKFQAKLYACHVVEAYPYALYHEANFIPPVAREELLADAERQLRALLAGQPVAWAPLVRDGAAEAEILRAAAEIHADLAVVATHGRSGIHRLLVGSVAERLLAALPCPVLVVRSPGQKAFTPWPEEMRFRRILVGCDFSPDSALALDYALGLAQELEAEVELVHVLEPSVYRVLDRTTQTLADDLERAVRAAVERRLRQPVSTEALAWCTPTPVVLSGSPAAEITRHAEASGAELIVLGIRGQGALEKLLVGSTTDRVVRQAPCPVLVVRQAAGPAARRPD
jgi:nucleotide-binding universal stress UspA family protein